MKFYKGNKIDEKGFGYINKAYLYNLSACIQDFFDNVIFIKNGEMHNDKNFSHIQYSSNCKEFWLNGKLIGYSDAFKQDFDKFSWRKYCKLKIFL